jgi:hypothetical protein
MTSQLTETMDSIRSISGASSALSINLNSCSKNEIDSKKEEKGQELID